MEKGHQLTPYQVWSKKGHIKGFLWYSEATDELFIIDHIGRGERRVENIDGLLDREELAMDAYRALKGKSESLTKDNVTIYFVGHGLIGQSIMAAISDDKEHQTDRLKEHYHRYKITEEKKYNYLAMQLELTREIRMTKKLEEGDSAPQSLYYTVLRKSLPEDIKVSDYLYQISQEASQMVNDEIRENFDMGKYHPEILGQVYLATGRNLRNKDIPDWSFILSKTYNPELPFFINYDKSTFFAYWIGYIYWTAFVEKKTPMEVLQRFVATKQSCQPEERNFAREEDFVYIKYHACMTYMIPNVGFPGTLTHEMVLEKLAEEHQQALVAFRDQHLPPEIADGREMIIYLADNLVEYLTGHQEEIKQSIHIRLSEVYSKLKRMDQPQIEKRRRQQRERKELTISDAILDALRPYAQKSARELCQKIRELDGQDGFVVDNWPKKRLYNKLSKELDIHHYQSRNFEIYLKPSKQ